jgi:NAD(P)-dependent dehydrogenase (short-subunit alcohol dehydrogenase family)
MILKGKRALVTGGAMRIGREITQQLQAAGVEVVVHYCTSAAQAQALSPFTLQADLSQPEACARLMEAAGSLDILINNAAIFTKDTLVQSMPERVQREFATNLFAPLELTRLFAAQGGGAVVNLLDRRIDCNDTSCAPYSLTKKSLADLTRLAALEYAPQTRVNAVAPGAILPPPGHPSERVYEAAGRIPLDQLPPLSDLAEAVLFLLKTDSITGQIIYIDGGQHLLGNGV